MKRLLPGAALLGLRWAACGGDGAAAVASDLPGVPEQSARGVGAAATWSTGPLVVGTLPELEIAGVWRWLLEEGVVAALEAGGCPATTTDQGCFSPFRPPANALARAPLPSACGIATHPSPKPTYHRFAVGPVAAGHQQLHTPIVPKRSEQVRF